MKRYLSIILLCSCVLLLSASSVARAAKFGKVTVDSVPLYKKSESTRRGYAAYLFVVKNSDTKSHVVSVKIPVSSYSRRTNGLSSCSRTCKLSAGQTTHLWLYQPAIDIFGHNALVTIDGRSYPDKNIEVNFEHNSLYNDSSAYGGGYAGGMPGMGTPMVAEVSEPGTPPEDPDPSLEEEVSDEEETTGDEEKTTSEEEEIEKALATTTGVSLVNFSDATMVVLFGRGVSGNVRDQIDRFLYDAEIVLSTQKASQWPTNWIAYSQFDGVVLTDSEFASLTSEAVNALADYVSVGGVVWVRPAKKIRATATTQIKKLRQAADNGMGTFFTSRRDTRAFKERTIKRVQCVNSWNRSSDAAGLLPALERNVTPVRLFLVLLIFYALLIGPALQFLLKRKRRRIWMLWIIPVTSILLCIFVFIGSYLSEGFHGFAKFHNITLLDQTSGRASSVGWASFYSPLSDGDGLRFSTVTVLQPQWSSDRWRNEESHDVAVDWTSDQHLTTGWLQAKTPLVFRLWKAQQRREKITIRENESGKLTATNALGTDAKQLKLCTPNGKWYTIEDLPAGETRQLQDMPEPNFNATLPTVKELCLNASNWRLPYADDPGKERAKLEPGTYQVMIDGHPFVNTAITNPAKDEGKTLIFGRFVIEK